MPANPVTQLGLILGPSTSSTVYFEVALTDGSGNAVDLNTSSPITLKVTQVGYTGAASFVTASLTKTAVDSGTLPTGRYLLKITTTVSLGSGAYTASFTSSGNTAGSPAMTWNNLPIAQFTIGTLPKINSDGTTQADLRDAMGQSIGPELQTGNFATALTNMFNVPQGNLPSVAAVTTGQFTLTGVYDLQFNGGMSDNGVPITNLLPYSGVDDNGYPMWGSNPSVTYSQDIGGWVLTTNDGTAESINSTPVYFSATSGAITGSDEPTFVPSTDIETFSPAGTNNGYTYYSTPSSDNFVFFDNQSQTWNYGPNITSTAINNSTTLFGNWTFGNIATAIFADTSIQADVVTGNGTYGTATGSEVAAIPAEVIAGLPNPTGPGGRLVTITVEDTSSNPVAGASVWLTSDIGGTTVIAGTLPSNAEGIVAFMVPAGVYYVWRQKTGYDFTNPQAITVTA